MRAWLPGSKTPTGTKFRKLNPGETLPECGCLRGTREDERQAGGSRGLFFLCAGLKSKSDVKEGTIG